MSMPQRWLVLAIAFGMANMVLQGCAGSSEPVVTPTIPPPTNSPTATPSPAPTVTPTPSPGAFESGEHPNLFRDLLGKNDAEIEGKLNEAWEHFFYGDDDIERVYYPVGDDMAYIYDVGSGDVRTEGMSYGMMIAVQMDKQEEFNRLWK